MKNVRLFAVAAALGMFASTVAAAETTTVKSVDWTGNDTVIKVDLGEKLIAPTLTATVTLDEPADCTEDTNGDGLIDGAVYAVNPDVNSAQGWLYTNAKYWATNRTEVGTAKYYLGLNGGRFLAPGSAEIEEDVFVDQLKHTTYDGEEALFNALVEKGIISVSYLEDGEIAAVKVYTNDVNYTGSGKLQNSSYILLTSKEAKKSDSIIIEDVVDYIVHGDAFDTASAGYTVNSVNTNTVNASSTYGVTVTDGALSINITAGQVAAGAIVTVDANKREYYIATTSDLYSAASKNVYQAVAGEASTTIGSATAGLKYVTNNTTTSTSAFTTADVTYLGAEAGTGVYNANYSITTSGALDALVYISVDELGYKASNIVTYEDTDIYVLGYDKDANAVAGLVTKITEKNAANLWIAEMLPYMYLGTTQLSSFDATYAVSSTKYTQITGYEGLVEHDYDYVYGGKGYYKVSARTATNFTAGGAVMGVNTPLYLAEKTVNTAYNQLTKLGKAGTVTIVDVSDADTSAEVVGTTNEYQGASVINRFTIDSLTDYELENNYLITLDGFDVTLSETEKASVSAYTPTTETEYRFGIYELENVPENDTEYWVIADGVAGLDLSTIWSYSSTKEVGTLETADGDEIDCIAVQLEKNGAYYPAFKTEAELVEAVYAITGLNEALVGDSKTPGSTFYQWYNSVDATVIEQTDANGLGLLKELPVTAIQPIHNAKACDYTVSSTSDKVTVATTNTIDTTVAGVYDLEYSATYNGEVVDTTSIKVVVAPNYTRTWENGRVKTLTSYYVSNKDAKYAEYNYNWAAGTATVTYYNIDGSVNETATINL